MTYQDDPNINRRDRLVDPERSNTGLWVAGAAAVMLVIGLIAWGAGDRSTVATNDRPAVTTPAQTTGSAPATTGTANTDRGNPAGNIPTKPITAPPSNR